MIQAKFEIGFWAAGENPRNRRLILVSEITDKCYFVITKLYNLILIYFILIIIWFRLHHALLLYLFTLNILTTFHPLYL